MTQTPLETVTLTAEQSKARRMRSVAIAVVLAIMVVVFYVATWVKLSANSESLLPGAVPVPAATEVVK